MPLKFHQAAFDNLGVQRRIDDAAVADLQKTEAERGFIFPAAVRELFQQKSVSHILMGSSDMAVSVAEIGTAYTSAVPFIQICRDHAGLYAYYVKVDGTPDPMVFVAGDYNDWETDSHGWPVEQVSPFSDFVLQQTEAYLQLDEQYRQQYR